MNMVTAISLIAWIPIVLGMFLVLKPRGAVLFGIVGGWLFLPMFGYDFEGLPTFDKASSTSFALLVGIALFDAKRLIEFRPHFIDIPAVAWCLCPFLSSLTNGLGLYDGLSESFSQVLIWGTPYFVGRLYFGDRDGAMALAKAVLIGAVIYVPLCLYEVRFSPQLHRLVYGMHQHSFSQTERFGGYRPDVFMQHGLMVALWMVSGTMIALWMVLARHPRTLWHVPMSVVLIVLFVTAVLCKSVGALMMLVMGVGIIMAVRYLRWPWVLLLALTIVPVYLTARIPLNWDGSEIVEAASVLGEERRQSLEYRFENEEILKQHHLRRPFFGWGGWDRYRVEESDTATDSLWILAFGKRGTFGLVSVFLFLTAPLVLLIWNAMRRRISLTIAHPALPLAVIVLMFTLDSLVNAMINPVYLIAVGAVAGAAITSERRYRRRVSVVHQRREPGSDQLIAESA